MLVAPRNERVRTIRITFILRKSLSFRSLNTFIILSGFKTEWKISFQTNF